jgi:uncharacterized coiled-coil DUF342 family protein
MSDTRQELIDLLTSQLAPIFKTYDALRVQMDSLSAKLDEMDRRAAQRHEEIMMKLNRLTELDGLRDELTPQTLKKIVH